jgi:hypothetical protein
MGTFAPMPALMKDSQGPVPDGRFRTRRTSWL